MPHLPGQESTWNIQYLLFAIAALIGIISIVMCRRSVGKKWFWLLGIWNLLWMGLAIHATVILWGEKY